MTELVADAERRRELPPMRFDPGKLSAGHRKPDFAELQAVYALSRVATGIELTLRFVRSATQPRDRREGEPPEEPQRIPEWRTREHKAIYRVLVAGAALAGAYNEPMFKAQSEPGLGDFDFRRGLNTRVYTPSPVALRFFEQFAVCNMNATPETEEAAFGPLASWLLETIMSDQEARKAMAARFENGRERAWRCHHNRPNCPVSNFSGGDHSDAHLVVWEVMQMVWMLHFITVFTTRPRLIFVSSPQADNRYFKALESDTALAVFFGVFHAERVTSLDDSDPPRDIPSLSADLAYIPVEEGIRYSPWNDLPASGTSAAIVLRWIRCCSGQSNWNCGTETASGGGPVAHLELKFFEYFLRRHLQLGFLSEAFEPSNSQGYDTFCIRLTIFPHDDVPGRMAYRDNARMSSADFLDGTEVLTRSEPRPTRVFRLLNWHE
jgi:hypothetical protein